jgi:cytoskeletal protein RodZ
MNDSTNNPNAEEAPANGPATGKILRDARLKANIDVNKICSDLRLSPQVIDALEKGDYHLLPGDPYIRALLGSLGRYLNLDTPSLIAGYNREIGAVHAAPSIAPYKDKAHTYTTAHKQIFVVVFLALFVVLFLLIGKLNKGEPDASKQGPAMNGATPSDSLSPAAQDTGLESHSLVPDSIQGKAPADSGEARPSGSTNRFTGATGPAATRPDTSKTKATGSAPVTPAAKPGSAQVTPAKAPAASAPGVVGAPGVAGAPGTVAAPAVPVPGAAPVTDTSHQSVAVVKPLIDSVGVKVMRTGKEDFATLLRLGKQMQVSHTDTIVVFISKRKSVEVILGGKSVIPDRKRFKIYGNTLKTF